MPSGRSRQFEHLQLKSLQALQGPIPPACPLRIVRGATGFIVYEGDEWLYAGRYQVVAAFVAGYLHAWGAY
jgi:hypothetical protein